MSLLLKVEGKVKNVLHKYLLGRMGFGNRVSKQVWEEQFGGNTWDYLNGKEEEAHYYKIVDFYKGLSSNGSILDVGCGKGVLYNYFKNGINISPVHFTGIDLSKNAVEYAKQQFTEAKFKEVDFDYQEVDGRFDVIIFNETLYYFNRPLKTLEKCVRNNLKPNGHFIVSMCDYANHDIIWRQIAKQYKTILEDVVKNDNGQKWKIKLIKPV